MHANEAQFVKRDGALYFVERHGSHPDHNTEGAEPMYSVLNDGITRFIVDHEHLKADFDEITEPLQVEPFEHTVPLSVAEGDEKELMRLFDHLMIQSMVMCQRYVTPIDRMDAEAPNTKDYQITLKDSVGFWHISTCYIDTETQEDDDGVEYEQAILRVVLSGGLFMSLFEEDSVEEIHNNYLIVPAFIDPDAIDDSYDGVRFEFKRRQ